MPYQNIQWIKLTEDNVIHKLMLVNYIKSENMSYEDLKRLRKDYNIHIDKKSNIICSDYHYVEYEIYQHWGLTEEMKKEIENIFINMDKKARE